MRRRLLALLIAGLLLMAGGWLASIRLFSDCVTDVHQLRLLTIRTYEPMVSARRAGKLDDLTWRAVQVRIRETRDALNAMDGAADAKRWWNPASAYRYDLLRTKAVEGLNQLQNLRDATPATTRSTA
jgi:hypothetical protein